MATHILQNAHHIALNNPLFVDNSVVNIHATSGLDILLRASIPEATHDSSARYPPPRCHPGTRQDYIDRVTHWSLNNNAEPGERVNRILWLTGPAGVGKSAIAQSCAEALGQNLAASFFFSRPNSRDDPNLLFTSIAHQLATKIDSFGDILDNKIRRNPTLVTKSIRQQFESLIVAPIQELKEDMRELVVIVDGIDECADDKALCDIIRTVAASVLDQTTPLLWIFFARPEPHIVMEFTSSRISPLSLHLELPVSRDIDNEISQYLTDELERVRKEHDLPSSWLSERDIETLVDLSAGLFVYAATVVRFVGERNSSSPEDQLRAVLALATHSRKKKNNNINNNNSSNHPLSELDLFYTLIMQRIPPKTLPIAQKILLATTFHKGTDAVVAANLLGLSESQFRNACCMLHSVLALDVPGPTICFYHASFMDFLQDPARSKEFCITTECAVNVRQGLLEDLNRIHASINPGPIDIPATWASDEPNRLRVYIHKVMAFFKLCQSAPLDTRTLAALAEFQYALIPVIWGKCAGFLTDELGADALLQRIPKKYLGSIIRPYPQIFFHHSLITKPENAVWKRPYVLGRGKNKVLCWELWLGGPVIGPYPNHWHGIANLIKNKTVGSHEDRA